jgi:thiol-disulfide isomerase/thioredoxin
MKSCGLFVVLLSFGWPVLADEKGLVGIRYVEQPEGLVVTKVYDGYGADTSGMKTGDLIVSIDGESTVGADEIPTMKGAEGSTVELGVRHALSSSVDLKSIVRAKLQKKEKAKKKASPKSVTRFAGAVRRDPPRKIREATRALMKADLDDEVRSRAVAVHLSWATRKRKKAARVALAELVKAKEPSPELQYRIGEVYFYLKDAGNAALWLGRALNAWPDDLARKLGRRGRIEEMYVNALWDAGEKQQAITLTRQLSRYREVTPLHGKVGMADPTPAEDWEIALAPLGDFEVELLDGSAWRLTEHKGKPVVLVFWASWCGPCKKELPALAELQRARGPWPVEFLAVSVDEDRAANKAAALVERWDLPFPATRTLALSDRFGVSGLPSMRIVGPGGSLRSATKGYSKSSIRTLEKKLDALVEETQDGGELASSYPFGRAWGAGTVRARSIVGIDDLRGVGGGDDGLAMLIRGHGVLASPIADGAVTGHLELEEDAESRGEISAAWFGGPLAVGDYWLRASDSSGASRWFLTTPSRVVSVVASGDQLWVAMKNGLLVFDEAGEIVHNLDVSVIDLAGADDGGVWAVDGEERLRLGPDGTALLRDEALGAKQIAQDGTWSGAGITELISGRFGPEGAPRVIGLRGDGTIVGLSGDGEAALRIDVDNDEQSTITAADLDGDGRDELVISNWGRGIATVELEIP